MKKTVVLGVTSGIAAYKSIDLVRLLKKEGAEVFVVMTESATKMVPASEFVKASGNKINENLFEENFNYKDILKLRKVEHIDLADKADVIVIAPATANVIAKLAAGIADDFLTTMVLASNSPIVLSPSMNVHMWNNPITQENLTRLKKRGFIIIPPEKGPLACGYEGPGRLPHVAAIKQEVMRQVAYSKSLIGKHILVTTGGTMEKIDDVRSITNRSSGKMGIAIAEECFLRGASVTLLRSVSSVTPRYLMKEEVFESTEDLAALVKRFASSADIIFHVAAVADFKLAEPLQGKTTSAESLALHLKPQIKISNEIKKLNPSVKLILFKAEWGLSDDALIKRAKEKLAESNADAIIANDVSKADRGFSVDTNEVLLVTKSGRLVHLPLASKQEIAHQVLEKLIPIIDSSPR